MKIDTRSSISGAMRYAEVYFLLRLGTLTYRSSVSQARSVWFDMAGLIFEHRSVP